jgi:type I restriction enzyme, S subunit
MLGDVSEVIRGITFPASAKEMEKTNSNVCCLRTTNIQREIDWSDVYFLPRSYVRREDQLVHAGDILMSMANSYELVGKVAVARSLPFETAFGAFLAAIRPRHGIHGQFLFHLLRTPRVQAELRMGSSQTVNIANISAKALAAIRVAIAPPYEQKRVADKLDSLLAKIDTCRERLHRVPQILKKFRESVLEAAVSGRLTEEWRGKSVPALTGAALAAEVASRRAKSQESNTPAGVKGRTNSAGKRARAATSKSGIKMTSVPDTWGLIAAADAVEPDKPIIYGILQPGPDIAGGVAYVQGVDIDGGKIKVDQLTYTTHEIAAQYSRSTLATGDVVLCIIRNIKVAIVPIELDGGNISRTIARLRPSSIIRGKYLATVLDSPFARRWFSQFFRGIDMPGLNLRDVRQLPIPLPSLEEQDEIGRRVDELFALADSLQLRYDDASTRVDKLTPSVLAKAYRGELVPQDPNDEPAAYVLERIQAKRGNGSIETVSHPKRGNDGSGGRGKTVKAQGAHAPRRRGRPGLRAKA